MKNFIEPSDLYKNFDEYICIDVRASLGDPHYGKNVYEKSHIAGAFFMDLEKDLASEVKQHGGRHPLPSMPDFIKKLESIGISNDTKVVAYDEDMASAPRLWWMLKHIGVADVKLLNGGFTAWQEEGLPVESGKFHSDNIRKGKMVEQETHYQSVDIDFIRKVLSGEIKDTVIIDSRSLERYAGIIEPIDKVAGRIPGALNVFFMDAYDQCRIKNVDELEKLYSKIDKDKNIIVHCGSGVTASANMAAMEEIDIPSTIYIGSYSDYVSYEENRVEKDL